MKSENIILLQLYCKSWFHYLMISSDKLNNMFHEQLKVGNWTSLVTWPFCVFVGSHISHDTHLLVGYISTQYIWSSESKTLKTQFMCLTYNCGLIFIFDLFAKSYNWDTDITVYVEEYWVLTHDFGPTK